MFRAQSSGLNFAIPTAEKTGATRVRWGIGIMKSIQPAILLVDDETNDQLLMQRAFKIAQLQHPVFTVSDGDQAVLYLSGKGVYADRDLFPLPVMILLDLKMPCRTGLEVLEWIRRQPAPLKRIPVIIMTSSGQEIDINRAYEMGANSYIVKPITFDRLLETIKGIENYWFTLSERPNIQL